MCIQQHTSMYIFMFIYPLEETAGRPRVIPQHQNATARRTVCVFFDTRMRQRAVQCVCSSTLGCDSTPYNGCGPRHQDATARSTVCVFLDTRMRQHAVQWVCPRHQDATARRTVCVFLNTRMRQHAVQCVCSSTLGCDSTPYSVCVPRHWDATARRTVCVFLDTIGCDSTPYSVCVLLDTRVATARLVRDEQPFTSTIICAHLRVYICTQFAYIIVYIYTQFADYIKFQLRFCRCQDLLISSQLEIMCL